jgi:hypothetical protein
VAKPRLAQETPEDSRLFVRISQDLPFNLKISSMSNPLMAIAAQVIAICTSANGMTDGHVPINSIKHMGVDDTVIKEMIEEGVWHDEHSDCSRCDTPRRGQIYIHDYLKHQRSSAAVAELRQKKSLAGAAGAEARWAGHRKKQAAEREKVAKKAEKVGDPSPIRPEIEMLCKGMATLIGRNDSKGRVPAIGKAWYEDMRKMIDIDGFSVEELKQVIEWTQRHPFWSINIKSPFKLRHHMKPDNTDLMGRMRRDPDARGDGLARVGNGPSRADEAMSVAERLEQKYGSGGSEQLELGAA